MFTKSLLLKTSINKKATKNNPQVMSLPLRDAEHRYPLLALTGRKGGYYYLSKRCLKKGGIDSVILDQQRKIRQSELDQYFHHIEIMGNKKEGDYRRLLRSLDYKPYEFAMIGNSLKSDVLPVLAIGGTAIHIPYPETWEHEKVEEAVEHQNFFEIQSFSEILPLFL